MSNNVQEVWPASHPEVSLPSVLSDISDVREGEYE